ncbi:MAG: cytochrome c peroxidase [Vicinamibacterales bacterium]
MKVWLSLAGLILLGVIAWPVSAQSDFAKAMSDKPSASQFFADRLPRWFPVPKVPADNPITEEKVELGRHLFYEPMLSGNSTYSCASCHRQSVAFTDGLAQAVGATGGQHPRSSMSLANVVYNASYGWSDRTWSLESQMLVPMHNENPVEMGLSGHEAEVLDRFAYDADYAERFRTAFPGDSRPITMANIVRAIASFERVIVSADSPFDRYLYKDDDSGMSPAAKRGVALFFSDRLKCSECHGSVNMSGPTIFTGAMPSDPEAFFHDTGVAAEPAKFRAPTLRNIAVTAPYMHDGSISTLKEVVAHYAAGGRHARSKSPKVRGFAISPAETDDLVAFLHALTDEKFLTNPAFSNPLSNPDLRRETQRGPRTKSEPPEWLTGSH